MNKVSRKILSALQLTFLTASLSLSACNEGALKKNKVLSLTDVFIHAYSGYVDACDDIRKITGYSGVLDFAKYQEFWNCLDVKYTRAQESGSPISSVYGKGAYIVWLSHYSKDHIFYITHRPDGYLHIRDASYEDWVAYISLEPFNGQMPE